MHYFLDPWAHIKTALDMCRGKPNFAFFMDMGTGKTGGTINAMREKYAEHKRVLRTLIVCPITVCSGWVKEFKLHASPNVQKRVYVLDGPQKERVATVLKARKKHGDACIFVMNYEALSMKTLVDALHDWGPEICVADESQRIKNPRAKRTAVLWGFSDRAPIKYILTGTPILQAPLDIFSQFRFLDGGATFGTNFYSFRARWFVDKNAGMPTQKYFPDWRPLPGTAEAFNRMIYTKAIRVMKDSCLDLPPFVRQRVEAGLGAAQQKAYTEMLNNFVTFLKGRACTAELAITKSLRLQQILSGYMVAEETGDVLKFDKVPRLDALAEIVEGLPADSKFVVWACFRENYNDIAGVVDKLGVKCVRLVGGMSKTQRDKALQRFADDPKTRCIIANPASAGVGVDGMQVANYAIYYSRNFNLEHDLQSNDRIYRGGSEMHKKVTRIDIVAPDTVDELILESLANKHTNAEAVLAWKKRL